MKKILFLAVLFASFNSLAQPRTEIEVRKMCKEAPEEVLVMECSSLIQEGFYYLAEIVADKLIDLNPQSSNYHYRKGYLMLDARNEYVEAMPHFFMAIKETNKNYDMYSPKETAAAVDAYYHLGRCYHLNYQFDEARKYYNLFIENSNKKSERIPDAQLRLTQVDVAEYNYKNPKNVIVKNVGPVINTNFPDYSPVISLDGQSLYFTSRREWADKSTNAYRDHYLWQFPEDIYVSYKDAEGEWTTPEKLNFCDAELNEATVSVSADEKQIYAYMDQDGAGDIYFSDFKKNMFDSLVHIKDKRINTNSWETHCSITPDGQQMYFVSDRPGGMGGRDIYRIVKLPDGKWSQPINMGPSINTPYDEDSPFLAVDNKTLYFSSNGPTSMGGFDVFMSIRDQNDVWSEPINLGYPINSTGDDVFYTTTVDGLRGYLASFRKDGEGEKDIYEIQNDYLGIKNYSVLKGGFYNADGTIVTDSVMAVLSCLNCNDEGKVDMELRMKHGKFFSVLERCKDYKLELYSDSGNYLVATEKFVTLCNEENEEIIKNAYLTNYALIGSVGDEKTLEKLEGASVSVKDMITGRMVGEFTTDQLGAWKSDFLDNKHTGDKVSLEIVVSKDDYLKQTFTYETVLADETIISLDYLLTKPEVGVDLGKVLALNPIYFDLDKSNIRPDAAIELDKIVKIMNENPEIKIELGSHTDCRASFAYNMKLSDRRAKSSAEYIQQRIDNPARIYGKGYGESQLVNDCACEGDVESDCSEEEHQANRRTEFKIVK